jgi:hypothetical protein
MRACSIGKWSGQEKRTVGVGGGGVYIGLSQKSSHWVKIQNPDNVQLGVSVLNGLEKTWSLLDSTIFTSFITPLLIVRCSYSQET